MTFRDWQSLSPTDAARELTRRTHTLLPPAQQRAVFALLPGEAQLVDAFARADRTHPLGGIPYLLKDLFDVAGLPTFAGSTFLPEVRPTPSHDSTIVTALRDAGAVFAGKTHLHEFAYGITGENPHYGDCEHPRFPGRTTGGSSSGSAAAVAAGIVPFAIGTDTGGSIRVPAAFCGLFGLRLTPGDPFIRDAFPLAPSFDTAGWFTANANDLRVATTALIGSESTTRTPRGCYFEPAGVDRDVASACSAASLHFNATADPTVDDELLHAFTGALTTYNTIAAIEAWTVHRSWAARYADRYDPNVRQRLERTPAIAPAEIDAARAHRAAITAAWTQFFRHYDFLVLPAAPFGALTKAECTLENRNRILSITGLASLGSLPVLTIPVALPSGLTSGLQIVVAHSRSPVIDWALARSDER